MNTSNSIPSKPNLIGFRKHPRFGLWAREGCAYFVNASGHRLAHVYSPRMRAKSIGRGYRGPAMRHHDSKACHILMGEIFYGERPTFINRKGEPYYGVCHHLIEDPLNYRPENLLCWLTYAEHAVADRRRRALEAAVPNGDLTRVPYDVLRRLQDPRVLPDADFPAELQRELTKLNLVSTIHGRLTSPA